MSRYFAHHDMGCSVRRPYAGYEIARDFHSCRLWKTPICLRWPAVELWTSMSAPISQTILSFAAFVDISLQLRRNSYWLRVRCTVLPLPVYRRALGSLTANGRNAASQYKRRRPERLSPVNASVIAQTMLRLPCIMLASRLPARLLFCPHKTRRYACFSVTPILWLPLRRKMVLSTAQTGFHGATVQRPGPARLSARKITIWNFPEFADARASRPGNFSRRWRHIALPETALLYRACTEFQGARLNCPRQRRIRVLHPRR